jgi:hypothetical protein
MAKPPADEVLAKFGIFTQSHYKNRSCGDNGYLKFRFSHKTHTFGPNLRLQIHVNELKS